MKKLKNIDFSWFLISKYKMELYGFCILWIMFFHAYHFGYVWRSVFQILRIGNMGVDIFLFISGICLYFSFTKDASIARFYKRRIIRVFTPMVIIMTPRWIEQLFDHQISLVDLLLNYSTMRFWILNYRQIWFISFIVVAYAFSPFIYRFIFKNHSSNVHIGARTAFLMGCSVFITVCVSYLSPVWYDSVEIGLTRFVVFFFGMGCGKLVYEKRRYSWKFLAVMFMVFFFCLCVLKTVFHSVSMMERYFYIVGAVPLTVIVASLLEIMNIQPLNRFLRFFGNMSLELYLLHMMLIFVCKSGILFTYEEGSLSQYLLLLAVSVLLGVVVLRVDTWISKHLKTILKA